MASRAGKRRLTVFSLSFLDVMSCGFGAVVLIFLIIQHRTDQHGVAADLELLSESRKLDYLIERGEADLVDLRERVDAAKRRVADASRDLLAKQEQRDKRRAELLELTKRTKAQRASTLALKADVDRRDKDVQRLREKEKEMRGSQVREVKGEGDRQYLTGLYVGGTHILIVLDASASMLDSSIVQILRRRNMSSARQRQAPKWRRALRIVEWLAAQAPIDSNFQIALYNTETWFALGTPAWRPTTDSQALEDALAALAEVTPAGGTNLESVMGAISAMRPLPDNVFLITDGLPTQGASGARGRVVTGRQRQRLFDDAADMRPADMPMNVILLPLEGDIMASSAYWVLAAKSGGTYMSPSRDWP